MENISDNKELFRLTKKSNLVTSFRFTYIYMVSYSTAIIIIEGHDKVYLILSTESRTNLLIKFIYSNEFGQLNFRKT